jgi:Flp pilus assembly pilin Flp
MQRLREQEGQTSIEYALLLVLCILAVILFMAGAGGPLVGFFVRAADAVVGAAG